MFILTKKTQITGNEVKGLEHSKMQKILPKKKKEEKFVMLQLHQIIPVIQKISRKKLNEVPP
jgi:hypothetical protein